MGAAAATVTRCAGSSSKGRGGCETERKAAEARRKATAAAAKRIAALITPKWRLTDTAKRGRRVGSPSSAQPRDAAAAAPCYRRDQAMAGDQRPPHR
jgi:hypothetical protein